MNFSPCCKISSLLGYWNTTFFLTVFTEHYLFRKSNLNNYDLEVWNTQIKTPIGIAGLVAFLLGITGCILGMRQTCYTGVIAKRIREGGDVGNQLACVFTLGAFVPLRFRERKRWPER